MYCERCGKQVDEGLNYCNSCGAAIASGESTAEIPRRVYGRVGSVHGNIRPDRARMAAGELAREDGPNPGPLFAFAAFYLAAIFGICYLIIRQVTKLIDADLP